MGFILKKDYQAGHVDGNSWRACGWGKTIEEARKDLIIRTFQTCPENTKPEHWESYVKEGSYQEQDSEMRVCSVCLRTEDQFSCKENQCKENEYFNYPYSQWQKIKKEYKELTLKTNSYYTCKGFQEPKSETWKLKSMMMKRLFPRQEGKQ